MIFLFDSSGRHIANEVNGELHATTGENIGHYIEAEGFFIDRKGYYLGEIMFENRLLYRLDNKHENVCYGILGDFGLTGSFGNQINLRPLKSLDGFSDIEMDKLK